MSIGRMMDMWEAIRKLVMVVEHGIGSTKENEKAVVRLLDTIALKMHDIKPARDYKFVETPELDCSAIRRSAELHFPNWGYYNLPEDITRKIAHTDIMVGDAIDDIADIVSDLKDCIWLYENNGENNALGHLLESYKTHWCTHLRELQCYLSCLSNDQ